MDVSATNNVSVLPKEDIDDNCPMTGDETDTEPNSLSFDNGRNTWELLDTENNDDSETNNETANQNLPLVNFNKPLDTSKSRTYQVMHDEEESLSSDQTYLSDEETSSVAGSFDDIGLDEDDSFSSDPTAEKSKLGQFGKSNLRNRLDKLGEMLVERECAVHQAREELQNSETFISVLKKDIQQVKEQIKDAEQQDRKAMHVRLKSKLSTLLEELNIEQEVKKKCSEKVEYAEFQLAQTYIEHSKVLPLNKQFDVEEKNIEKVKAEKAYIRMKKELAGVAGLERKRRNKDKEHLAAVRERERRNRQSLIAAKKNRELATKYLKYTMSQVRQRESEEEEKSRTELNRRMNALLSLKQNIELNKENLKSNHAGNIQTSSKKDMHVENNQRPKNDELSQDVASRRKRLRQIESDKEAFERKQREREIGVINNPNLLEEKQLKRRIQQQPQLWPDNRPRRVPRRRSKTRLAPSSGSESMEYGADVEDTGGKLTYLSKFSTDDEGEFSPYGASLRDDNQVETTETDDDENVVDENVVDENDNEELNEPEFKGLWEENNSESNVKKYQQLKTINNQVSTATTEKKTKGCGFINKPSTVVFKDLSVGETYTKTVVLTNSSVIQSHCQYVGVSDNLKDFITVGFTPPGAVAAGMSFEISVVFKPMVNEDLFGEIEMTSEEGLFYIPVHCLVKKCQVSVSEHEVDFKSQIIGETRTKIVLLKNSGALSTSFTLKEKISEGSENLSRVFSIGDISTVASQTKTESFEKTGDNSTENCGKNDAIEGTLLPFSTMSLKFIFSPDVPMCCETDFVTTFSDETLDPITIKVKGLAMDLPVRVEREVVDLQICMFDRLYQDAVVVSNSASYALRILVEVPSELQNHVDVLPKTAYIQAESQFSLQLKFLPRKSLSSDASKYYNKDDELLKFPVTLNVADQTQPVKFDVKAIVTPSDFKFDPEEIDFGVCNISEKVLKTATLTNVCSLVQHYGFVKNPEFIDVQQNDGFGTVLPNESIKVDIYFAPDKAKDYNFTIFCKSHIGREFNIKCKGVGTSTPLTLSQNLIQFKTTAIGSESRTHIFVSNVCEKNYSGKSSKAKALSSLSVSFKFCLEDDCPVRLSPSVGTLLPGEKRMIHVIFAPIYERKDLTNQSKKIQSIGDVEMHSNNNDAKDIQDSLKDKTKNKLTTKNNKNKITTQNNQSPTRLTVDEETVRDDATSHDGKQYQVETESLLSYKDTFACYKIPCFMSGDQRVTSNGLNDCNPLFLQVECPSVKVSLLVLSDTPDNTVDFGSVTSGKRHTKGICLQNVSQETLQLKSSILDPLGPFELVNTLNTIKPDQIITLHFSFTPYTENEFYETLEITSLYSSVKICLKGRSIQPRIEFEPCGETFHVGETLVGDTITSTLKIKNSCQLPLQFDVSLGSLSPFRHIRTQDQTNGEGSFLVSPNNSTGVCVFSVTPLRGCLEPDETKDLTISFSPETTYDLYHDQILLKLNGIEEFKRLHITATACPYLTYTRGWLQYKSTEENQLSTYSKKQKYSTSKTVFLEFVKSTNEENKYIEKSIEIGCVRLSTPVKKPCDFVFENTKEANDEGFTVEPLKGNIEMGGKKNIFFKWLPRKDMNYRDVTEATMNLVIRGDVTLTYKVNLCGRMTIDIND